MFTYISIEEFADGVVKNNKDANRRELIEENPEFGKINITMIDESAQPEIADKYDYYYVPCWFAGKEKLFEGHAEKADVEKVLRAAAE